MESIREKAPTEEQDPTFAYGVAFGARVNHQTARKWLKGEEVGRGAANSRALNTRLEAATKKALDAREQEAEAAAASYAPSMGGVSRSRVSRQAPARTRKGARA
jgi:hypothetical protein